MPPKPNPRDPWRKAPVGELQDQLLPRWFVLLCVALVPIAIIVIVVALLSVNREPIPLGARRPPPAAGLTHDVGDYEVGDSEPVVYADACPTLEGVSIAGGESDQAALRQALAGVCNTTLPADVEDSLRAFASAGGVVRFALFTNRGVDSAAVEDADPPTILVNARLQQGDPLWISPVVVHDAVTLAGDPGTAAGAVAARRAEDLVCDRILGGRRDSTGCQDAEELLALPDPEAALRDAGYR